MCRRTEEGSWTYGRAPNAIDILYGVRVRASTDTGHTIWSQLLKNGMTPIPSQSISYMVFFLIFHFLDRHYKNIQNDA